MLGLYLTYLYIFQPRVTHQSPCTGAVAYAMPAISLTASRILRPIPRNALVFDVVPPLTRCNFWIRSPNFYCKRNKQNNPTRYKRLRDPRDKDNTRSLHFLACIQLKLRLCDNVLTHLAKLLLHPKFILLRYVLKLL